MDFKKIKKGLVASGWLADNGSTDQDKESVQQQSPSENARGDNNHPGAFSTNTNESNSLPHAFMASLTTMPTEPEQKYLDFVAGELEKLNLAGIDSFELGVAVRKNVSKGMALGTAIEMAFDNFQSIDKDLSVEKLVSSCDFYIKKLQEVLSDFNSEKDQELAGLQKQAETKISALTQTAQRLSEEENKLQERLKVIAQQKQQSALDMQTEGNNLKQAQQDMELRKVNMKLAVVKVGSVIQSDREAIVQHLKKEGGKS